MQVCSERKEAIDCRKSTPLSISRSISLTD
jgi:hypothetical protein